MAAWIGSRVLRRRGVAALIGVCMAGVIAAPPAVAEFDVVKFTGRVLNQDGTTASQAGSHPYAIETTFEFPAAGFLLPEEEIKDVDVSVPPGLIGNPSVTPVRCTSEQLSENGTSVTDCPPDSQVGVMTAVQALFPGVSVPLSFQGLPIYNMVPPPGNPAMFGVVIGATPVLLFPAIRSDGDFGLDVHARGLLQAVGLTGATATSWKPLKRKSLTS